MKFCIVDDDVHICKLLNMLLCAEGECTECNSGQDALKAFQRALEDEPFDVVIMDMMLADYCGDEVVLQLRALEEAAGISDDKKFKLIVITAYDDVDTEEKLSKLGAFEFVLHKPFTDNDLFSIMQKHGIAISL